MKMTKPYIDFGLQSDRGHAILGFWSDDVGLKLSEVQPVYEGVEQYRYALHGAVLKLNMMAQPMAQAPRTGYRKIVFTRQSQRSTQELVDPDGNQLLLAPAGYLGEQELGLVITVSNMARFRHFYGELLQLSSARANAYIWGKTQIQLQQADDVSLSADDHGAGFRYITFQVSNLDELHRQLIDAGVTEHMPPTQWSETSYVSFIRDPDNNLIELSQRADLLQ